jgi:hypothetical protein
MSQDSFCRSDVFLFFVTPAKAGIQLRARFALSYVMAGLDPAISRHDQMRGSSPRMTKK